MKEVFFRKVVLLCLLSHPPLGADDPECRVTVMKGIDYLKMIGIILFIGDILWSVCYLILGKLINS